MTDKRTLLDLDEHELVKLASEHMGIGKEASASMILNYKINKKSVDSMNNLSNNIKDQSSMQKKTSESMHDLTWALAIFAIIQIIIALGLFP